MIQNEKHLANIQKKAGQALVVFLAAMILLTVLSRAATNLITPVVTCTAPEKTALEYKVTAAGTVKEKQQQAVHTVPGIRVKKVLVSEGDHVSPQDILFELDTEDLAEKILLKDREIEKLKLALKDSREKNSLEQQEKSREQNRAEEDYSQTADAADAQVQRAWEALIEAEERLDAFDSQSTEGSEASPDSVEEELQRACEEKSQLLEQAQTDAEQKKELLEQAKADRKPQEFLSELENDVKESEYAFQSAREACTAAEQALEDYQASRSALEGQSRDEERQMLEDAYTQAQNAYEDALRQQEEGLTVAQRKIEDTRKPTAPDSTPKTTEMDLKTLQMEQEKYTAILEAEGQVCSPAEGIVRKLGVEAGSTTVEGSCVTLADISSGCRFTASLSKEEAEIISNGDGITLRSPDGKKTAEGLTIHSLSENKENPELTDITADISNGEFDADENAVLYAEKKSAVYSCVVPLEALRTEDDKYFVLLAEERENILGTELTAVRAEVEVLEKNKDKAALKNDDLSGNSKIILSSQKNIKAGDRIRLEDE